MFGASGVYSAVDMASQSSTGLLKTFALTMTGGLASGVTSTEVLWVICPEHAAILARDGYSKAKLRAALFGLARVPYDKIADENLELLARRRPFGSSRVGHAKLEWSTGLRIFGSWSPVARALSRRIFRGAPRLECRRWRWAMGEWSNGVLE